MTPARYIRDRRIAAGMSLEDVAACLETVPHRMSVMVRAEWLGAIEDGTVDVTLSTALALSAIPQLAIDVDDLASLADGPMSFRFVVAPTMDDLR